MKKTVAMLLVILLTAGMLCANAATYTLPEKMEKQQQAGSGLKGSFTLNAEGDSQIMSLLNMLNDREIQIRSISARDSGDSVTSLYLDAGDDLRQGLVEIMKLDGNVYIRSDYTDSQVLSLGNIETFFDLITAGEGQNIQPWTMLKEIFSVSDEEWEAVWTPVIARYLSFVETWMNQYAASPETYTTDDGQSAVVMQYEIQPDDIRSGIVALISKILNDEDAISLLSGKMTQEVSDIYLNKDLIPYYEEALNAMELNGPVILIRRMTTKGEDLGSEITLPLGTNPFGFDTVSAFASDGKEEWTFSGEKVTVNYIPGERKEDVNGFTFTCGLIVTPGTEKEGFLGVKGAYSLKVVSQKETNTDEEGKQHQTEELTVDLSPSVSVGSDVDPDIGNCKPLTFKLTKHYSSKLAQTSATTLEIEASYEYGNDKASGKAKVKTTSAWELVPFDVEESIPVLNMTEEEFNSTLQTLLQVGK